MKPAALENFGLSKTYHYGTEHVEIWTDGAQYIFRFGVFDSELGSVLWLAISDPCPICNHP